MYDAYGEPRITLGVGSGSAELGNLLVASSVGNPYMHQGLRRDDETGLHENRMRVLHSRLGRFMQRDPAGYVDGLNLYLWCGSAPYSYLDPLGLDKCRQLRLKEMYLETALKRKREARDKAERRNLLAQSIADKLYDQIQAADYLLYMFVEPHLALLKSDGTWETPVEVPFLWQSGTDVAMSGVGAFATYSAEVGAKTARACSVIGWGSELAEVIGVPSLYHYTLAGSGFWRNRRAQIAALERFQDALILKRQILSAKYERAREELHAARTSWAFWVNEVSKYYDMLENVRRQQRELECLKPPHRRGRK